MAEKRRGPAPPASDNRADPMNKPDLDSRDPAEAQAAGDARLTARWSRVPGAAIVDPTISAEALRVLNVIALSADFDTFIAEVSVNFIAAQLRCSRRMVQYHLDALEAAHHIERTVMARRAGGTAWTAYRILHRPYPRLDLGSVVRRKGGRGAQTGKAGRMAEARAARASDRIISSPAAGVQSDCTPATRKPFVRSSEAPRSTLRSPSECHPDGIPMPSPGCNPASPRGCNPIAPGGCNPIAQVGCNPIAPNPALHSSLPLTPAVVSDAGASGNAETLQHVSETVRRLTTWPKEAAGDD